MDSDARTVVDGAPARSEDPVARASESDPTPLRVGRYFIFRPIGEGGMGQVLLGYDEALSRKVAIKLWRPRPAGTSDDLRARMLREAQALARLSHPNVVQVYEVDEHRGQLFLAMEYVEGKTLREWVKSAPRDLALILDRYLQAGQGLAAAHHAGVLHRDFKPDNAVVGDDGRVRVLDFGLARADSHLSDTTGPKSPVSSAMFSSEGFDTPITVAGSVLGTPAYMAPEQLVGAETDVRSEVYSYCVALWEAIHGLRPYAGGSARELAAAIGTQRPRESKRPVPGWLRAALLRGLAPDPAARWPDMDSLLAALVTGARRRRWRIALALGLALVALIAGIVGVRAAARAREVAACEARGAAIDAVLSADARAAVRAALLASRQPYAPYTAERVDALLGEYAESWSKGQVLVCARERVEGRWSAETAARADACLDERREGLAAAIHVLREADASVTRRAIEAASSLTAIDLCLDEATLARRAAPPPGAGEEVAALRQQLARARALDSAGRYTEGAALSEALIARADALGWPPLAAEARLVAGGHAASLGERDAAKIEGLFEDALFLALDAGEDALATRAALELLDYTGLTLLRPAEGQRWARLARALVVRLDAERPALEAELACSVAELFKVLSRLDEAALALDRCYDARVAAFGPAHPRVALAIDAQAGLATLREDPVAARDLLRRSMAILEPAYGADHPLYARSLTDLGEVLAKLGDAEAAEASLKAALAIDTRVFGPLHQRVGGEHYDLGQLYLSTGRIDEAVEHLSLAVELYDGIPGMGRPMQIAALSDLGVALRAHGDLDAALAAETRALDLYTQGAGADHPGLAPIVVELAEIQRDRGELERSRELAGRARRLLDGGDTVDFVDAYLWLGDLARGDGDLAQAELDYDRARGLAELHLGPEHRKVGIALSHVGDLARERGRVDAAIDALTRAVALLDGPGDPRPLGVARFALARALEARGDRAPALAAARLAAEDFGERDRSAAAEVQAWIAERDAAAPGAR